MGGRVGENAQTRVREVRIGRSEPEECMQGMDTLREEWWNVHTSLMTVAPGASTGTVLHMQPIDPTLSLAMSVQSNPGVYALLIGSGVSTGAGIPTGWQIVEDLVRKLATLRKEECGDDAAAWYHTKYGHDPSYSELLNQLAKTPAERQQLLRSYFEATEEEREEGAKRPSRAHHAIAELVAGGFIRVVLTTNFDKLIERAIEARGENPVVVSTPDATEGMQPLAHQKCCVVVKLHGDYTDTRIKNSPKELAEYDERTTKLLNQVLDEFGLIICGWSADHDAALRGAIERCKSRRYSFYWVARSDPRESAKHLIHLRGGEVIRTDDADTFFGALSEHVETLEETNREHPKSVAALVSQVKRYIARPEHRIRLRDLAMDEAEGACDLLREECRQMATLKGTAENVERFHRACQGAVERCMHLIVHGLALTDGATCSTWVQVLDRVGESTSERRAPELEPAYGHYPIALLFYAGGLAALSQGNHDVFAEWLTKPRIGHRKPERRTLLLGLAWWKMSEPLRTLEKYERHKTPINDHLHEVLREPLRRYLPSDEMYDEVFDRFEYLRTLVIADTHSRLPESKRKWNHKYKGPPGRFVWRSGDPETNVLQIVASEAREAGERWPILVSGLFGGSFKRFWEAKEGADEFITKAIEESW